MNTLFPLQYRTLFLSSYLNIARAAALGLIPLLHALVAVPHVGNAVAPLEVGARNMNPREARVALHHRPPGVWAVAIARDEIFCGEETVFQEKNGHGNLEVNKSEG